MRYPPKSLWSYNPSPTGCVLYLPLWHPNFSGPAFKDPIGHTATVTEATYGVDGRTFDGDNDVIAITEHASITNIFDGGGTVMAWVYVHTDGEADNGFIERKATGQVLSVIADDGSDVKVRFSQGFDGATSGVWTTTAVEVTLNAWVLVTVTYNADATANNPIVYIDTTAKTVGAGLTEDGVPDGTRVSDAGSDMFVGGNSAANTRAFDGGINTLWGFDRILPATEITYIHNRTVNTNGM